MENLVEYSFLCFTLKIALTKASTFSVYRWRFIDNKIIPPKVACADFTLITLETPVTYSYLTAKVASV